MGAGRCAARCACGLCVCFLGGFEIAGVSGCVGGGGGAGCAADTAVGHATVRKNGVFYSASEVDCSDCGVYGDIIGTDDLRGSFMILSVAIRLP